MYTYIYIQAYIYICVCTHQSIASLLPSDLSEPELEMAKQPGMYGRVWYGQGLAFDEAYQILQDSDTGVACHMPPSVHSCRCPIT